MAGSYLPLATATAVVAILVATTSTVPVSAAAADKYSGRIVIIRAPGGAKVLDDVSSGGALNKWRQHQRRRGLVEDEVAPEFGGLLGAAANGGHVSDGAEDKDRAVCLPDGQCAKQAGGSYTRGCTYEQKCTH